VYLKQLDIHGFKTFAEKTRLVFAPGIMGMGGNTGIQTSTVTVRSLATGHLKPGVLWRNIWRELRVAMSIGLVLGALIFGVARLWTGDWLLGSCVGLAMFSSIAFASALGAMLPLLFRSVGVDPAVASGPRSWAVGLLERVPGLVHVSSARQDAARLDRGVRT